MRDTMNFRRNVSVLVSTSIRVLQWDRKSKLGLLLSFGVLITVAMFCAAPFAEAHVYWSVSTGDWSTSANWQGGEPTDNTNAIIANGGTASVTQLGESCYYLYLGNAGAGNSGAVQITGGSLTSSMEYVGVRGVGSITQSGGTNTILGNLILGYDTAGEGTYTLDGGTLILQSLSQGNGAATFNFGGGTLQATADFSANLPITLTGTGGLASVDTAGHAVEFSGTLSGTGGLRKLGAGTLCLASSNAYSGGTEIGAGTLSFGNGSLGTTGDIVFTGSSTLAWKSGNSSDVSSRVRINDGITATFDTGNNAVSFANNIGLNSLGTNSTASVTKTGTGLLTFAANNTYTGNTCINEGTLSIASTGALPGWNVAGKYSVASGAALAVGDAVTDDQVATMLNTGNYQAGSALGFDVTGSRTFDGSVLSTNMGLVKHGSGTLRIEGNNTFAGGTTIREGKLIVTSDTALGTGTITIGGGKGSCEVVAYGDYYTLPDNPIVWNGDFTFGNGSSLNLGSGPVALGADCVVKSTSNTLLVGGVISGDHSLTKDGSGRLTLNGANTFSGGLVLTGGDLLLGNGQAIGTGTFTMGPGTSRRVIRNYSGSLLTFSNNNPIVFNNGLETINFAENDFNLGAGLITLLSPVAKLDVFDDCCVTIGNDISGAGKLIVGDVGSGTIVLSGHNTYTGGTSIERYTLEGITLLVASPMALPDYNVPGKVTIDRGTLAVNYGGTGEWTESDVDMLLANALIVRNSRFAFDTTNATAGATYSGVITGDIHLAKRGANNLTLSAASTHTGITTIDEGTLTLGHENALRKSELFYDSNGGSLSFGTLTTAILGGLEGGHELELTNTSGDAVTLCVRPIVDTSTHYYGNMSGNGTFVKFGEGIVVLSGDNTHTGGTILDAGRLCINSSTALGTGTLWINGPGSIIDESARGKVELSTNNSMVWNADFAFGRPGDYGHDLNLGAGAVTLSNNRVVTVNGKNEKYNSTLTVGGSISGNYSLTKDGLGELFLTGTNTYTGGTNITAGTLGFHSGGLGTVGNISLSGNITLQWCGTNTDDISDRLQITEGSTVTLHTGDSDVVLANEIGIIPTGESALVSLTKNGSSRLTLSAANACFGPVTISQGVLNLQNSQAIGTTPGLVTVNTQAVLELEHETGIAIQSKELSLDYSTLRSCCGANRWSGTVNLYGTATVASDSENLTLDASAAITGADPSTLYTLYLAGTGNGTVTGSITGSLGRVEKCDAGKWTLTAANTFYGSSLVSEGTLNIQNAQATGATGNATVDSGATLELEHATGFTVENKNLTLKGNGVAGNGALRNICGDNAWNGSITLDGDTTIQCDSGHLILANGNSINGSRKDLTLQGTGTGTIAGTIDTSSGTLTKNGTGTWTLTAANAYSGITTVNAGTLNVANTSGSATGSADVIVLNDGALAGSGIIDGGVAVGGTLSPGNSTGILTVNNQVVFEAGAIFEVQLNGLTAGDGHDQLVANGLVELDGTLSFDFGDFIPGGNDMLFVIDNLSLDTTTGTFQYADDAFIGTFNGFDWYITYDADDGLTPCLDGGNDVALYSVPEPSFLILFMVGMISLAPFTWRRRK